MSHKSKHYCIATPPPPVSPPHPINIIIIIIIIIIHPRQQPTHFHLSTTATKFASNPTAAIHVHILPQPPSRPILSVPIFFPVNDVVISM